MPFENDFGYSIRLFSSLLKKREKKNEVAKIVINSHAFLLDPSINIIPEAKHILGRTEVFFAPDEKILDTPLFLNIYK